VVKRKADCTVPTRILETPEKSLSRKLLFLAFPKIHFFTGDNQIFFGSSHNGRLFPEFFQIYKLRGGQLIMHVKVWKHAVGAY
jgi:hypothetical protein